MPAHKYIRRKNMPQLICAACGKKVTLKVVGSRKFCEECHNLPGSKRKRLVEARHREAEEKEHREQEKERKRDPFNPALMSDRRLGAVIKLFGMTYGTYTAAYRSGILVQILKAKGFENPAKILKGLEVE